jgi:hypothetical protein
MSNTLLAPIVNNQQFLANGSPANGAKLFTYLAGSTTKQTTYADLAGSSQNANPIVLDSGGNIPASGEVRLTAGVSYKFVLAPSNDSDPPVSPYWTKDNISGITDSSSIAVSEWAVGPTPTYISTNSFSVTGDQTSVFTSGRRVKAVDTGGTVYGTIISSTFSSVTTVVIAADGAASLDSGLSSVSYGILNATNDSVPQTILHDISSPFRNRFINPYFEIVSLYGTTTYNPVTGTFPADRWKYLASASGKLSATVIPYYYTQSIQFSVVAQYSPGAAESFLFQQQLAGINVKDFRLGWPGNDRVFTLSFFIQAPAGTYSVSFRNAASNRSYVATYAVSQTNIKQFCQVTVPSDVSGTWAYDTTLGLSVSFDLGSGANYQTTPGSWQAGDFRTTSTSVQMVNQTNGTPMNISDVCLEPGPVAIYPRERRPIELEQMLCQAYMVVLPSPGVTGVLPAAGPAISTTVTHLMYKLPVKMRAAPSLSTVNPTNFQVTDGVNAATAASSIAAGASSNEGIEIDVTVASGLTQYRGYALNSNNTNAQIILSAEL